MDVKLESLIEKIKRDGIEEAKKSSDEIINKAKKEAEEILKSAREGAKKILADAKADSKKLQTNTEKSLQQAARDLILSLKDELRKVFAKALKAKVSAELTPHFMSGLIAKIVDNWTKKKGASLEVLVSDKDKKQLEKILFSQLKTQAKERIEIKVSTSIEKGFRIGIKGEDLYYDFTDESITEALRELLNPSLSTMLNLNNG